MIIVTNPLFKPSLMYVPIVNMPQTVHSGSVCCGEGRYQEILILVPLLLAIGKRRQIFCDMGHYFSRGGYSIDCVPYSGQDNVSVHSIIYRDSFEVWVKVRKSEIPPLVILTSREPHIFFSILTQN